MADRVDPGVHAMQTLPCQSPLDCPNPDARGYELRPGDDAMLAVRQIGHRRINRTIPRFPLTVIGNDGSVGHGVDSGGGKRAGA